ncbi:hypothetical protein AB4144_49830, partial [Rhizobiaceae sp. 2RAB30]
FGQPATLSMITLDPLRIVGGGPAGLAAAAYPGAVSPQGHRGRRPRRGIDPTGHNCSGFPDGIAGFDLLERLRQQALLNGACLVDGMIREVRRDGSIS